VQLSGYHVEKSAFYLFSAPADPAASPHISKKWKRNVHLDSKRNGARNRHVSFLETRNAESGAFYVSWKRNTRKMRVCFLCFLFPVFRLRPYWWTLFRNSKSGKRRRERRERRERKGEREGIKERNKEGS